MTRPALKFFRRSISIPVIIAALLCAPSPALAGDDAFHFDITPYLWLPSVNNQLDVKGVPIEFGTNIDATDVFDKLDFAFLVAGQARIKRFGVYYDVQGVKLSDDGNLPRNIGNGYHYSTTFVAGTLGLQYRLFDERKFSLDLLAGARAIYAEVSVGIDETARTPELKGDQNKWWVDPIVGIKGSYHFTDKWAVHGYADYGGFDTSSRYAYQLIGTVSYSFTDHIALQVGYRFFADDYENGAFKLNTKLYGPVAGLTFSF